MITKHKQVRETVENDSWESIDRLKEKYKDDLACEIDKGMKQKSDLTLIITSYKKAKGQRDSIKNEI